MNLTPCSPVTGFSLARPNEISWLVMTVLSSTEPNQTELSAFIDEGRNARWKGASWNMSGLI